MKLADFKLPEVLHLGIGSRASEKNRRKMSKLKCKKKVTTHLLMKNYPIMSFQVLISSILEHLFKKSCISPYGLFGPILSNMIPYGPVWPHRAPFG